MRLWFVLAASVTLAGCVSPSPGQSVAQAVVPGSASAADVTGSTGRRIAYNGMGGFTLPDGSEVIPDTAGGFTLPNGAYVAPDGTGGVVLPNGSRCVSDGARGYLCP